MKSKLCSDCALKDQCKSSKLQIVACSKYTFENSAISKYIKFLHANKDEITKYIDEMNQTGLPYTLPKY